MDHKKEHMGAAAKALVEEVLARTTGLGLPERSREPVMALLAEHLHKLVYNVIALSSTVAEMHDRVRVGMGDIEMVRKYIHHKCRLPGALSSQRGGGATVLPSEYFGRDSGRYTPQNVGGDRQVLQLDQGLIREELGMQGGAPRAGEPKAITYMMQHLVAIAAEKEVKVSRAIKKELRDILTHHMLCLMADLMKLESTLTATKISEVLGKRRHGVFW